MKGSMIEDIFDSYYDSYIDNLQDSGDAEVSGKAMVYGDASVSGDAEVYGNAMVYGDAMVSCDAEVYGNARVSGDAGGVVGDFAVVPGRVGDVEGRRVEG